MIVDRLNAFSGISSGKWDKAARIASLEVAFLMLINSWPLFGLLTTCSGTLPSHLQNVG